MGSKCSLTNKIIFFIVSFLLAAILLFLAFLPNLASTEWGKNQIERFANQRINGLVRIEKISASWWNGQKIEGVTFSDRNGQEVASLASFTTEAPLLYLLFGSISGSSSIENFNATIIPFEDGTSNIQHLLSKKLGHPPQLQAFPPIILKGVEIVGSYSPHLQLHLQGETVLEDRKGTFLVDVSSSQGATNNLHIDADIRQFPVFALDQFVAIKNPSLKGVLLALLGETLDIKFSQLLQIPNEEPAGSLDKILFDALGEKATLSFQSGFSPEGNFADMHLNGKIHSDVSLQISEDITLVISSSTVEIVSPTINQAHFKLQAAIALNMIDSDKHRISDPFFFDIEGDLEAEGDSLSSLHAVSLTMATNDEPIRLIWDRDSDTVKAWGAVKNLPLNTYSPLLESVFGSHVTGSFAFEKQDRGMSPVSVYAQGPRGAIALNGQYNRGILTLNQPLEGRFQATPRLVHTVLTRTTPLLSGFVAAENPITFSIQPERFALPLFPIDLARTRVPAAMLDLGRTRFRNDGKLAKLLSILRPGNQPELSLWFTPLYVNLEDGTLTMERFDLLVQQAYPLAAWGSVDLLSQAIKLEIGVSPAALTRALSLRSAPDSYIAVPLRGPLHDPQINQKVLTAKISGIIAEQQAGAPGVLIGTVLKLASGDFGSGKSAIPSPTVTPLPWEELLKDREAAEIPPESKVEKVYDKVSKRVSQGVQKLFDKVLTN